MYSSSWSRFPSSRTYTCKFNPKWFLNKFESFQIYVKNPEKEEKGQILVLFLPGGISICVTSCSVPATTSIGSLYVGIIIRIVWNFGRSNAAKLASGREIHLHCTSPKIRDNLRFFVHDNNSIRCRWFNRYRRELETCSQSKTSKSGHAIFFSFFPTRPSDKYDSAPSRKYSRPLLDVFACIGFLLNS